MWVTLVDAEEDSSTIKAEEDSSTIKALDDGECEGDDVLLLSEADIPGASLNGKLPGELNIAQLKRWLACHGAPVHGRKQSWLNGNFNMSVPMHSVYFIFGQFLGSVITVNMAGTCS